MMCTSNMRKQNKKKKNNIKNNQQKLQSKAENKMEKMENKMIEKKECEVIFPPGSGKIVPNNSDKTFQTYSPNTPETLPCLPTQCVVPQRMAVPSGMSGQFHFMSAKALRDPTHPKLSVSDYLERYLDMYVCLDFWQGSEGKKEKCGILNEVGKDFIVIEDTTTQMLSVIDLKPVHYINIFCP